MTNRRPWDALRIALAAAILTSVWRVQDLFPALAPLKLPSLLLLVLLSLMAISPRERFRARIISRQRVMRGLFVILALAAVSIPMSLWAGMSLDFLLKNMLPAIVLAVTAAAAVYTVSDARRVAAIQVFGAALYAIVILTQFEVGPDGRLGSLVYYDANDLGMLLVCTLPLALLFVGFSRHIGSRLLAAAIIGLYLATIVKTGSRGALLGLIAVALYLLARYTSLHWSHRVATVAGVVLIFVAATGAQYWSTVSTILSPRTDYNWIGNTEGGRMAIWGRGLSYMADRPVTGLGLAAFPLAEGTISPLARRQQFSDGVKWSAPHNSFLQIGAELGVLALVIFIATLVGALLLSGRLARDALARGGQNIAVAALARAQGAALVGYAVAGFFLSQAYAPFLFVLLGMIVGLDLAARLSWRPLPA